MMYMTVMASTVVTRVITEWTNTAAENKPSKSSATTTPTASQTLKLISSNSSPKKPQRWQQLPKLPIPSIEATFATYLKDLEAIEYDQVKLERTKAMVSKFMENPDEAEKLQKLLIEYDKSHDCWAHDFWLQDMYFRVPLPLMVNSNPGLIWPPIKIQSTEEWLWIAAKLIGSALEFKSQIDDETLAQDTTRTGTPLCMKQYQNVFYGYRRAGVDIDERVLAQKHLARHIIVAHNGQFAKLQVLQPDDDLPRPLGSLHDDLESIVRLTAHHDADDETEKIGLLTAQDRRWWGRVRQNLLENGENAQNLVDIEQSLFILCLDEDSEENQSKTIFGEDEDERTHHMLQMVHGGGTSKNSCNRWFEKSLQFILPRNGKWGLNYEHSNAEGGPMVRLAEHVYKCVSTPDKTDSLQVDNNFGRTFAQCSILTPPPDVVGFKLLHFKTSPEIHNFIKEAELATENLINRTHLQVFTFSDFGKNVPKQCKVSPDCFVQVALQMAFYRCHTKLVATYESASIRGFERGRVDVIRGATREAYEWVKVMDEPSLDKSNKKALLMRALERQRQQMESANMGNGVDNHIGALQNLAKLHNMRCSGVFDDESLAHYMKFALSTSQVPVSLPQGSCMGYGAVTPDGYGCSYNIHEECIVFSVSCFSSDDCVKEFCVKLTDSLRDIRDLLL